MQLAKCRIISIEEAGDIERKKAAFFRKTRTGQNMTISNHREETKDYSSQYEPQAVVIKKVPDAAPTDEADPWEVMDLKDTGKKWGELTGCEKVLRILEIFIKLILLLSLLYLFICSLDFLSSAFRLLGGKVAGRAFTENSILSNPVALMMLGVLATVLVQSSSTSTSIVVTMVGSGILNVPAAIPIIMGANIGTSVTNTIVSMGQVANAGEFRRAFAGATVHDMFNWLTVIVLLPIEALCHPLYHLTKLIVGQLGQGRLHKDANPELLKALTKPFTKLVVQIDKKVINQIATNNISDHENVTLLKLDCHGKPCKYAFRSVAGEWSDAAIGAMLLVISLLTLCAVLVCIVKLLHSILQGRIAVIIKKTINADFPGCLSFLTGYLAILVGCALTILVQSSSIFTSALTPLVGVGVIHIERMFPLTLGSNIGTTVTAILASLTQSGEQFHDAIQVAFCHLFFNIAGILVWYPIPFMRKTPINLAKFLGNTTAKYRWFAIFYLIAMFFIFPAAVFGLSVAGWYVLVAVAGPFAILVICILVINLLQKKRPSVLPDRLKTWKWLPLWMRSLEPLDNIVKKLCFCCKVCKTNEKEQEAKENEAHTNPAYDNTGDVEPQLVIVPTNGKPNGIPAL